MLDRSTIACLAHDQNNFLQAAFCLLEALKPRLLRDQIAYRKLAELRQAIECIDGINTAVLFQSRAAGIPPPLVPIDPDEVIERVVALARSMDASGVQIELRLGGRGTVLSALTIHVQQVVLNLLKNALEASPADHGRIVVETSIHTLGGRDAGRDKRNALRITIADNGAGIPENIRPRLFDYGCTSKTEGHGLGLHHARMILDHYGGSISLSSGATGGTRAVVTWPLAPPIAWIPGSDPSQSRPTLSGFTTVHPS